MVSENFTQLLKSRDNNGASNSLGLGDNFYVYLNLIFISSDINYNFHFGSWPLKNSHKSFQRILRTPTEYVVVPRWCGVYHQTYLDHTSVNTYSLPYSLNEMWLGILTFFTVIIFDGVPDLTNFVTSELWRTYS